MTFYPEPSEVTDLYLHRSSSAKTPDPVGNFNHVAYVYSVEPEKSVEPFHTEPSTGEGDTHKHLVQYVFSLVWYVSGCKRNTRGGSERKSRTIHTHANKY